VDNYDLASNIFDWLCRR